MNTSTKAKLKVHAVHVLDSNDQHVRTHFQADSRHGVPAGVVHHTPHTCDGESCSHVDAHKAAHGVSS